ncbi:MAG: hypothetical protein HC866_23930 [Leptolyngbyaceae cyanobacterium RU_5_1]|nr:hypothetical protein [Leptolyngbyaceae cyanobacterium RU_5_1]
MTNLQAKPSLTFGVVAELTVAGSPVKLHLLQFQEKGVTILKGGMLKGQRLLVVALLEELMSEALPIDSMRELAITQLDVELRPTHKVYRFAAAIEDVWSLNIDELGTIAIEKLQFSFSSAPNEASVNFVGLFLLFDRLFSVTVDRRVSRLVGQPPTSQWTFNAQAKEIILSNLVRKIFNEELNDDFQLRSLSITNLSVSITQATVAQVTQSSYTFNGEATWSFAIAADPITVQAAVNIQKYSPATKPVDKPDLAGSIAASVTLLDALKVSVRYAFAKSTPPPPNRQNPTPPANTTALAFELQIDRRLTLTATYRATANQSKIIELSGEGTLNFGKLLTFFVNLIDPGVDDFQLDSPWDKLNELEVKLDRDKKFVIDLTRKNFSFYYQKTYSFLSLVTISEIGLSYQGATTTQPKAVNIVLTASILGQSPKRMGWDPVNEPPPAIPSQGATIFDLQFLAVGQRVSFDPKALGQLENITLVMAALKQGFLPLPPAVRKLNPLDPDARGMLDEIQRQLPPAPVSRTDIEKLSPASLQFNPESNLLLAAQFSLLDTLDMSLVFNDPLIYGVRISLYGAKAKIFAGLVFEILYRRISDTIGVYHIELVLPDAMRQLEFGAVSVTLPIVVVDIYTNGDFKLDFGFPWRGDFSRSFCVQVFPFIGFGGFYFNKLSAETATSVPVITNGKFNPVIEFGLGLAIGLGKSINKGFLKAELSISIVGILQGVIARFNPDSPTVASDDYYKIQGGIGIVGRLYGVVDFSVIQVEVEVVVKVMVLFVVEAYEPIFLTLTAQVSVRASIKILFVRIRFSFNLTLTQSFKLGSKRTPPWKVRGADGGNARVCGAGDGSDRHDGHGRHDRDTPIAE